MRRYLAAMLGTTAAVMAMAAAVNVVVDPFAIHGTALIAGFNEVKPGLASRARLWKSVIVARHDWEAVVVGTSRAEVGIDPGHSFFGGRACFNAATGNQPYEESAALVQAALDRGKLRQVLAVLDFPISNAHVPYPPDYTSENFRLTRPLVVALSADALVQSFRTPLLQDREFVRQHVGLWRPDGRFVSPPPMDHRAHALESEDLYLTKHYFPPPTFRHAFSIRGHEPLAHVRRLVATAHASGLDLTMLIAPAHARQWETLVAGGRWNDWEEWKRRLAAINEEEARRAGRKPYALWDFSGYNWMTVEPFPPLGDTAARMTWYWDSSHFVKEAGDLVLARMAGTPQPAGGFGVQLSSATLESHLAETRRRRDEWRKRFPADVAEIAELARQGRARRDRLTGLSSIRP